jgi:hypothetical protein
MLATSSVSGKRRNAQAFHESRNPVDVAEVAGAKRNAATALRRRRDRLAQIVAFTARDRDHMITRGREPLRDRKPDAAAAACQENITHLSARAFRPP